MCLILEVIIGLHLMEIMKEFNKEWILMWLSSFSLSCQTHNELDVIKITCEFEVIYWVYFFCFFFLTDEIKCFT